MLNPRRGRLALRLLLLLLVASTEARRGSASPEEESSEVLVTRPHRHRHRHEATSSPRWLPSRGRNDEPSDNLAHAESDESEESDYPSYDYEEFADGPESSEEEEGPSRRYGLKHSKRRYEPRYPASRYHHRAHRARGAAHEPRHDRTAGRHRSTYRAAYHRRHRDEDEGDSPGDKRRHYYDEPDEDEEYLDKHRPSARKRPHASRPRYEPRKDWRYKLDDAEDDYAYDADDETEEDEEDLRSRKHAARRNKTRQDRRFGSSSSSSSKFDEWMKLARPGSVNESRPQDIGRKWTSRPRDTEDLDEDSGVEEDEEEEWKEDETEEELDNDFGKNDEVAGSSLRRFDDLIRRLTEERTTTAGPVRRGHRNLPAKPRAHEARRTSRFGNLLGDEQDNEPGDLANEGSDKSKRMSPIGKERAEDQEDEGLQADANADYVDDENEEEEEESASPSSTTSSPATTSETTSTTTTTTTMTTARPVLASARKDNARPTYNEPLSTGAQYNGYQTKNDYPAMSAHSALKWQYLGTRESVKETRNNMAQYGKTGKSAEMREAHNHALRVSKEGSCQWPRAKVIPVHDVYPNSTATYIPHCAILHRCSDDTGCCRSETLTCEPKQTQRVELYFYATYIHGKTDIEKLSFINHTECECRERKDFGADRQSDHRSARHYPSSPAPQNILRPSPTRKPCRCPTQFTPKITMEGVCECSCIEHDLDCLKLQRGKGYLSLTDRICIQNDQCTTPSCTFGEFIIGQGRCPKKKDIFEATTNRRPVFNYYHRRS